MKGAAAKWLNASFVWPESLTCLVGAHDDTGLCWGNCEGVRFMALFNVAVLYQTHSQDYSWLIGLRQDLFFWCISSPFSIILPESRPFGLGQSNVPLVDADTWRETIEVVRHQPRERERVSISRAFFRCTAYSILHHQNDGRRARVVLCLFVGLVVSRWCMVLPLRHALTLRHRKWGNKVDRKLLLWQIFSLEEMSPNWASES